MKSIKLFCFPYAGASAAVYSRWKRRLPAWIELVAVEPPGHGRRMKEPLQTTLPGLLAAVVAQVQPQPGQPYALFGHSLGALLAFELAVHLLRQQLPDPLLVFATGTHAPSRRDAERFTRLQTDAELKAELVRLQGTPACVLEDAELMALTLPILRADFQIAGSYVCPPGRRIRAPLHVVGGTEDSTTPETLHAWSEHTLGELQVSLLPGGHFFLQTQEDQLLQLVERRLRERLAQAELQERTPPVELAGEGAVLPHDGAE
jgi:surfactin synthase thioesterase subunit